MGTLNPYHILETLFPYLRVAAAYANQIQSKIAAQPAKDAQENFFAAALSDADLSIQTMVEVALLGNFPHVRFYGEEYELSYNTKYFRSIELGPQGDYLVTLDPIDGTRFYLDGHSNYQIILGILDWQEFAAAITILPAQDTYYYALEEEGSWQGSLNDGLESHRPLQLNETSQTILVGWGVQSVAPQLQERYQVISIANDYSQDRQIPSVNGILTGELAGVVLRSAKFIDNAALAFLAKEAGCLVTDLNGNAPPPLYACQDYQRPGLIMATSGTVHQHLLQAVQGAD